MSSDHLSRALIASGKTVTSRIRIGDQVALVVKHRKAGLEAEIETKNARGESTSYPLHLDADAEQELDAGGPFPWENKPGVEKMLRALVSVGNRPSDYGIDRAELTQLAERRAVGLILAHVPVGRPIGRAKITLTPRDLGEAMEGLTSTSVGHSLVRSLVSGEGPTRVVSAGIPTAIYDAIAHEAERRGQSVNQLVGEALSEYFTQR